MKIFIKMQQQAKNAVQQCQLSFARTSKLKKIFFFLTLSVVSCLSFFSLHSNCENKNRSLVELAAEDAGPGAFGAQRESVHEVLDRASTEATPHCASAVEFSSKNRSLVELAAGDAGPGAFDAQRESVHEVLDRASTEATPHCASAVEFSSKNRSHEPLLLIEPTSQRPPIAHLIPGAKETVIAAGLFETEKRSLHRFSFLTPSWKTKSLSFMNHFLEEARHHLSKHLAELHPRFLRDEHNVIQVAIIDASDPLTASTILAPNFAEPFVPVFGSTFLIALPTKNRIYIFSKLASPLDAIASTIRDDYELSLSPLSLEIFELGPEGLHAVGSLR